MAVTVVRDHPQRHLLRRVWRQLVAFSAGLLFVVGSLAACVAFSMGLWLALGLVGSGNDPEADGNPWLKEILLALAISLPLAIVGIKVGLRMLRGERGLVLFLRRFGDSDATNAMTFAARKTVGGSWRLVTLDDEQIAPVGMSAGTRKAFRVADLLGRAWQTAPVVMPFWVKRVIPLTVAAMLAVFALELLRSAPDWSAARDEGAFAPYTETLESLALFKSPADAIGLSLPGVFAVLAILLALEVAAIGVFMVAFPALVVLVLVLLPLIAVIQWSANSARKAEASTRQSIHVKKEIRPAAESVVRLSRSVFAPKLIVLRVATPVWRQTVSRFAEVCSAPLIDLSDVSENVFWEIEELTRRFGPRCLLVGRHDRVAWLADPPPGLGSDQERLLRLIEGHEVLAYTTDRRGIRRFARSLRAKLLTVESSAAAGPQQP